MPMHKESLALCISDVHIGKETPRYNLKKAQQAIERCATKLVAIADMLRPSVDIEELYLLFLGDILDGTDIYPAQAVHQDVPDVFAQAQAAAQSFKVLLEAAREVAPRIVLTGVAGNHGRSGKSAAEAANWDIVFYKELTYFAGELLGDRVTHDFHFPVVFGAGVKPAEYFWLKLLRIRQHWYLLHHGHRARGALGIPYYGVQRRAMSWRTSLKERWRVLIHGHFHQFGRIDINDFTVLLNGTSVEHDTWALESFGSRASNKWWLLGISDRWPITYSFALELSS